MRVAWMRTLVGSLFCIFSLAVRAQQAGEIPRLLDSATQSIFDDYTKGASTLDQIEKMIHHQKIDSHLDDYVRLYQLRITLNRYYFHPRLCRQYLGEITSFLDSKKQLFEDRYTNYRIHFDSEWAGFYLEIGDFEKAFELFSQSLDRYKKLPPTPANCKDLFRVSQYMASILQSKGEMEAAINQYLASLEYYKCGAKSSMATNYPLVFSNIGKAFLSKGDARNARHYFKLAEDSLEQTWLQFENKSEPATSAINLFTAWSNYYQFSAHYDSALLALQKAEKYITYSEPFRAPFQLSLGHIYEKLNKLDLSHHCYERAIQLLLANNDKDILLSDAYSSMADLLLRKRDAEGALRFYQQAIGSLVVNFDPKKKDNPELVNVLSKKNLFQVLQRKYSLLEKLSVPGNDEQLLRQAWQTNQLALALIDSTANEITLDKDKVILAEQSFQVYEDGIRLSDKLFKLTGEDHFFQGCFAMMDKSKGILLLENLRLVNHFADVDKEWLDKERDLKSELLFYEQEIFQLANASNDQTRMLSVREDYAKAKRDHALLMDSIKKSSPSYYQLRFNRKVISAYEVQHQLLQPDEAIIEFFVGDKSLVVAGFSHAARYLKVKEMVPDFTGKVIRFRNLLMASDSLSTGKEFEWLSSGLYDYLLKDCLFSLGTVNRLTIIPDGILGYLPFEVLRKEQAQPSNLIEKYSIRYAYSASYLEEQSKKPLHETTDFFGGFLSAGNKDESGRLKRNGLSTLKYAKREMASIAELLGTHYTVFENATKEDFINHASNYRVLHLAMHAQVNDENPMFSTLMFQPDDDTIKHHELFAIELYDMKLNSDLAVLSACETGVGKLHRGEGIMSFSRAFAFAGVPAAVISLWKVPDKATSLLMLNFYTHLKNGYTKDISLQKAKLDFITVYPQMSHPYYWSGFVLMGNNVALPFPVSYAWVWWTVAILVLMIAAFVIWKKKWKMTGLPSKLILP